LPAVASRQDLRLLPALKPPSGHQLLRSSYPPYYLLKQTGKLALVLLVVLRFTGPVYQSYAQENLAEPWTLEADRITSQNDPQQITATGAVVLLHKEAATDTSLEIKADAVTYQAIGTELNATGNIFLKEDRGSLAATSIRLNLQERTGTLTDTSISITGHHIKFSGKLAEKINESRYIFYDGRATSCRSEGDKSPAWSINWREADINVDGMAYLKHATFKIKEVPLLYIPYLVLPAKTSRQTGLLFPEISHSDRDGLGGITPFFTNLSPSSDLTFYPGYYEKRGAFAGVEFRHVTDASSRATFAANYQHDRTEDQGLPGSAGDYRKDGYLRSDHDRYWLRGKVDHHFSPHSVLRLDLDAVSDQDFLHEYREGMTGFAQSNRYFLADFNRGLQEASIYSRESILQFTSRGQMSSGGVELRYTDNVLSRLTAAETPQTLPRASFSSRLPLISALPLTFGWDSEYVHYRPEEGIGYQRLDLSPKLIVPMPLGSLLEGTIAAGLRETFYMIETIGDPISDWDSANSKNRNSWDLTANIATSLARDFRINDADRLTHTFRPNLRYNYQESGDQSELPDLDNFDRLGDGNNLTLELNNYFRSSKFGQATFPPRQNGYLKLSQSYNLDEARRNLIGPGDQRHPFSELTMDLEIAATASLFLRYQTALDVYGAGVTRYKLQGRYSNTRQDQLAIDYNFVKGEASDLNLSSQLQLTGNFSARYSTTRSLSDNHTTSESIGLLYNSQCWGVELERTRDSEDQRIILIFSLTGIGKTLEVQRSEI
jgi:LPS-assembly protein